MSQVPLEDKWYSSLSAVAREYGICESTLRNRLKRNKMSILDAVTKPVRKYSMSALRKVPILGIAADVVSAVSETAQEVTKILEEKEVNNDNINPSHYKTGKYECIDVLQDLLKDAKGIEAFYLGNAIKYLWRYKNKNGLEDLQKSKWYLDRLIEINSKE